MASYWLPSKKGHELPISWIITPRPPSDRLSPLLAVGRERQDFELNTTFDELGVDRGLVKALAANGIEEAFPIQELTIADALAGRDVCGKAKTGSGKTLAFGLPVLERVKGAEPRRQIGRAHV